MRILLKSVHWFIKYFGDSIEKQAHKQQYYCLSEGKHNKNVQVCDSLIRSLPVRAFGFHKK